MAHEQKTRPTWINLHALMTEDELAQRWRKSTRTLQRYRTEDSGAAWLRIGGRVLYRLADVVAFEEAARNGGRPE